MKSNKFSAIILAGSIFFAALPDADVAAQTSAVKINAQTKQGAIKPVNGICNGPFSFGEAVDCSHYYKTGRLSLQPSA